LPCPTLAATAGVGAGATAGGVGTGTGAGCGAGRGAGAGGGGAAAGGGGGAGLGFVAGAGGVRAGADAKACVAVGTWLTTGTGAAATNPLGVEDDEPRADARLATDCVGTARAATDATECSMTRGNASAGAEAPLGRSRSGGTISESANPKAATSLAAGVRSVATIVRSARDRTGRVVLLYFEWYLVFGESRDTV
jgi:hypothetical protein